MATATEQQPAPTNNNDQAAGEKPKGKSDDKCIGNRRIRTILLSGLLFAFSIFAAGYIFDIVDSAKTRKDACNDCDHSPGLVHGANFIAAGLVFCWLFLIIQMILLFIPACDPSKNAQARIPGIGNILGGGLYLFGWIYYISKDKELNIFYDAASDDIKSDFDAVWLAQFGEALLFGGSVILMGIDVLIPARLLMEKEGTRLLFNLGILCTTAILTTSAYLIQSSSDLLTDELQSAAAAIAAGYIIIAIATLLWIILFIVTCDKCTDTCITRVIIGVGLGIGGLVTAIGYWVYAGEGLGDEGGERVAYYVGYTILVGGLVSVWGLDVLWDDVKNVKK